MAEKFWNRHDAEDRLQFAKFLDPLVLASRTKNFTPSEASVYLLTLADVPREILGLGVMRLLEQGVTWMPKPGDIKAACADVVDERRKLAIAQADALSKDCATCQGTKFEEVKDDQGFARLKPCWCRKRGLELIAEAGNPIQRPALPPASSEVA